MTHEAESDLKSKFRRACVRIDRHFPEHLPRIMVLTDPGRTSDITRLAHALPAGSGLIYRHFGAEDRRTIAAEIAAIAKSKHLVLLIGNDPHLALEVGADGVHWPETNMNAARKWDRRFHIMTAAAHSLQAIRRAEQLAVDATLVSTVFKSRSASAGHPLGPIRLRRLVRKVDIPIYGLGGLTADNSAQIADFSGIASIDGADRAFRPRT